MIQTEPGVGAAAGIGLRRADRDVRLAVARHVADARDAHADVRIDWSGKSTWKK